MGKCFRSAFLSIVSVKRDFHVARQRDLEAKPSPLMGCSVWEVPDAESESEQVRTCGTFYYWTFLNEDVRRYVLHRVG